jgi:AcrR family transcriptional regulator
MSVASRRKREREERRASILEAAARVFFSKGFQVATMDEVAAEAELSKGTLYLYFKNKDDLFLALSARVLGRVVEQFEQLAQRDGDGLAIVRAMLDTYAANAVRNPDHFRAAVSWLSTGVQVDTETPAFARHRAMIGRLLAALVGALERGRADGSIRPELEPAETAPRLWAGLYGVLQIHINRDELDRRVPRALDSTQFVEGYIDLLCAGLRPTATTAEAS